MLARLQSLYEFSYTQQVIITPRELVTLGKMLSVKLRKPIEDDHAFFEVTKTLLIPEHLLQFKESLQPPLQLSKNVMPIRMLPGNFQLLPSRQGSYDLFRRFLHIVQTSKTDSKLPQAHLPIFMLEGPAGCGKSTLVQAGLLESHYQIITVDDFLKKHFEHDRQFCIHAPPSFDSEIRQLFFEQLLTAHQHPLVWIDEANTQELDEQTLNRVLDAGLHMIITQNPADNADYAGRYPPSPALQHRSLRIILPAHSEEERQQIQIPHINLPSK